MPAPASGLAAVAPWPSHPGRAQGKAALPTISTQHSAVTLVRGSQARHRAARTGTFAGLFCPFKNWWVAGRKDTPLSEEDPLCPHCGEKRRRGCTVPRIWAGWGWRQGQPEWEEGPRPPTPRPPRGAASRAACPAGNVPRASPGGDPRPEQTCGRPPPKGARGRRARGGQRCCCRGSHPAPGEPGAAAGRQALRPQDSGRLSGL